MKSQTDGQGLSDLSLIKALAANDRVTRDRAVQKLRQYLSYQQSYSETEFLKLWKGLFYCMWMSDRPLTQQQLASDLANLVENLDEKAVIPFLSAFWKTMAREWRGIDVLRMNKFLLLVRYYFRASIKYFMRRDWLLESYMEVLANVPLNPTDAKIPDGLRYHLMDIYVDELDNIDPVKGSEMPLENILEPIRYLGRQSPNRIVRKRVKTLLDDPRLAEWEKQGSEGHAGQSKMRGRNGMEGSNDDEAAEWNGIDE